LNYHSNVTNGVCAACTRSIDAAAKLCPYCGADPATGERIDTQALMQEVFQPKSLTTSESVLEYARQRQGLVVIGSIIVAFLALLGLHQFANMRNAQAVTDSPAVPLTEITDLANQKEAPVEMPELDFPYEGRPQAMTTFIVEQGAVSPVAAVAPPANPAGGTGAARPITLPRPGEAASALRPLPPAQNPPARPR
jgi:hypothetical protein